MKKTCNISGEQFEIEDSDLEFYRKMDVPPPTISPSERARRRMSFANQRTLFHRTCAGSGKKIITNVPPTSTVPVFDISYWFSDSWDMFATGRDYKPAKSFFEQFKELMQVAPRPNLQRNPQYDENSDYTNYAGKNKNCYLIFDSDKNRDSYYSYSINSCNDVVDCFRSESCELCYQCIDSINCYGSQFLQNCDGCSDSAFLKNCIGCKSCFGSVNLRNKSHYFFNEPCTPDEYQSKLKAYNLGSSKKLSQLRKEFNQYSLQFPQRYMQGVQNEDVTGDYLSNCKNATNCFDSRKLWDCKYVIQAFDDAKDCMDCTEVGDGVEQLYECCYLGYGGKNDRFCTHCLGQTSNLLYCYYCPHSSDCFGCVGLHHAKFCILNKQYSESDYHKLVAQIISEMKNSKEWGEFFPASLAPFPYNLSHAQDFLPLSKGSALKMGYQWYEEPSKPTEEALYSPPDSINEVDESVLSKVLKCSKSGVNYKIQKGELNFYKKMGIPLPALSPNERFKERLELRTPRNLFHRNCSKCDRELYSSISSQSPLEVLCDVDFQAAAD